MVCSQFDLSSVFTPFFQTVDSQEFNSVPSMVACHSETVHIGSMATNHVWQKHTTLLCILKTKSIHQANVSVDLEFGMSQLEPAFLQLSLQHFLYRHLVSEADIYFTFTLCCHYWSWWDGMDWEVVLQLKRGARLWRSLNMKLVSWGRLVIISLCFVRQESQTTKHNQSFADDVRSETKVHDEAGVSTCPFSKFLCSSNCFVDGFPKVGYPGPAESCVPHCMAPELSTDQNHCWREHSCPSILCQDMFVDGCIGCHRKRKTRSNGA